MDNIISEMKNTLEGINIRINESEKQKKSELEEKQSIFIMRAFREMRHFIMNNERMFERINSIELKQLEYQKESEEKFNKIFDYIADHKEDNQKIFFDGQIYDAFSLLTDIVGQAKREIVLIDGYIDVITLNILAKKNVGIDVFAYTLPSARMSAQDIHRAKTCPICARTIIQAGINNVIMRQGEGADNYIILPAKELQWVLDGEACE